MHSLRRDTRGHSGSGEPREGREPKSTSISQNHLRPLGGAPAPTAPSSPRPPLPGTGLPRTHGEEARCGRQPVPLHPTPGRCEAAPRAGRGGLAVERPHRQRSRQKPGRRERARCRLAGLAQPADVITAAPRFPGQPTRRGPDRRLLWRPSRLRSRAAHPAPQGTAEGRAPADGAPAGDCGRVRAPGPRAAPLEPAKYAQPLERKGTPGMRGCPREPALTPHPQKSTSAAQNCGQRWGKRDGAKRAGEAVVDPAEDEKPECGEGTGSPGPRAIAPTGQRAEGELHCRPDVKANIIHGSSGAKLSVCVRTRRSTSSFSTPSAPSHFLISATGAIFSSESGWLEKYPTNHSHASAFCRSRPAV